jgi:hypothetical protein
VEEIANRELAIEKENHRMIAMSNGWDLDRGVDKNGHLIGDQLPQREVLTSTFLPEPTQLEREQAFKESLQPGYWADRRAAEQEQHERDPAAEAIAQQVGRQLREFEQAHDMRSQWSGRESRRDRQPTKGGR